MKSKRGPAIGFMICLIAIIILTFPLITFALNDGPPKTEAQGNIIPPDQFAEADALRYGGLFGPLPDPYEHQPMGEMARPMTGLGPTDVYGNPINTRDMGFGAGVRGFDAINRRACAEGALSCPGS